MGSQDWPIGMVGIVVRHSGHMKSISGGGKFIHIGTWEKVSRSWVKKDDVSDREGDCAISPG